MIIALSVAVINFIILLAIAILHFTWAVKGTADAKTLPTTEDGKRILNPKKTDCVVVGFFLLLFATLFLVRANLISVALPNWINAYSIWAISGIFFLRFIGDFRYVGIAKKIRTTEFAWLDTKYYSPLCLIIALNGAVLELLIGK